VVSDTLVKMKYHVLIAHRLSTGIRALDHAVESLYGPSVIPPMKHLCYGAIVDLFKYLPESKADPNDIHARQKLQVAAWMSLWPTRLEQSR
jgi:alcohol dehydrogenase class IV